ncbi:MAG: HD domain-containing protein [Candidatus Binatia bacterium]
MEIIRSYALLDELFDSSVSLLGVDFHGYRNHAYRVFNFARELAGSSSETDTKFAVAAYFHDLGIWADHTFDYLTPSVTRARDYLAAQRKADWMEEVSYMITEHHKITSAGGFGALVEAFRRADWIDVTLGLLSYGLPRYFVREVRREFPNEGFHRRLLSLTVERIREHPTRPLPMFKW